MLHGLAVFLKELAGGSRHDGRSSRRPPSSRPPGPLRQTVSLASILLRYSLCFGLFWLACGMLAFSILWLLDLQETLLVVSAFFVLLSSLLSCHLFFYAKRDVFDRDVLRVIDYVYLLIGSFGLMGAFDVQEYLREERMALALRHLSAQVRHLDRRAPFKELDASCTVLWRGGAGNPGCRCMEALLTTLGGTTSLEELVEISNECPIARDGLDAEGASGAGRADEVPLARGILAELPYEPVRRYLDEYAGKEIRDDLLRVRALVKVGGIFLVAGAMGLRITRVTVEMRGWWKA